MEGKTILIVGASRGIGKEIVLQFAQNKSNRIYALARNPEGAEIFKNFPNIFYHQFDLENSHSISTGLDFLNHVESIDILINNAGKLVNKPFLELSTQDIQACYQVNIMGVMTTIQTVLPKMLPKGGHIINISSMGGFQGSMKFAGLSAYSTSKAALASLTELLAEEFKDTKVAFNCLCLGAVQTEMLEEAFPGYEAPVSANEMATYIVDFASHANQWIKGKVLPISLSTP
jgi:3-oxoacyl-[acyl-carrier protein] reductase